MECKETLEQILKQGPHPREEILWADKPLPRFFTSSTTVHFVCGILWTICIALILIHSARTGSLFTGIWQVVLIAAIFVPFFALGLLLIFSPLWEFLRTRHTIYSITSERTIAANCKHKSIIWSRSFEEITQIRMAEKRDGLGDIIIVCGVRVVGGHAGDEQFGFYNIRTPREVAQMLEQQVKLATRKDPKELIEPPEITWAMMPAPDSQQPVIKETSQNSLTRTLVIILVLLFFMSGLPFILFRLPSLIPRFADIGIPAFLFLVFLLLFLLQLRTILFASQSTKWPTTEGIVLESYIIDEGDGGYVPKVKYTYQVGGKEYFNNQITTTQRSNTLNRQPAEEIVARYPEGGSVTVYYHPKKPNYAVLEPGRGAGNWIVVVILLSCLLASGIWLAKSWSKVELSRLPRTPRTVGQRVYFEPEPFRRFLPLNIKLLPRDL